MKLLKKIGICLLIVITALLSALNYKIFVFPNSFAPAGVDGLCTMIQYLTNTNMGYLSLIFNIPLLLFGFMFFGLKRNRVIKTSIYIAAFSLCTILLDYIDLSDFMYYTETGTSIVLAPIASGVVRGLLYPITLKAGGTSGGGDIIADMIRFKRPHYNMMNILFALNAAVAICAYFVYGFKIEPVICSIIYSFVTSTVSKSIQAVGKEQIRFEIITSDAERLCTLLTDSLGVSATLIEAKGAYSGADKQMVICVTTKEYVPKLEKILQGFDDSVVFESTITSSIHLNRSSYGRRQ